MSNNNWNYQQLIFESLIFGLMILSACSTDESTELDIPDSIPIEEAYFVQLDLTDRSGDTFKVSIHLEDLTADENIWGNDTVSYWINSDNDDDNWEEVQQGVAFTPTNKGNKLRWMVVFDGSGADQTYIENLTATITQ